MRNFFLIFILSNVVSSFLYSGFHFIENKNIEQNKKLFEKIEVANCNYYDNFGDLEKLQVELVSFFISIGNDHQQAEKAATILSDLVFESLQKINAPTGWVTIRASLPDDYFKIPRWHTDGYYYAPYSGVQTKIACTLKGPGTLFCKPLDDVRERFMKLQDESNHAKKSRIMIAELLKNEEKFQAPVFQPIVFKVGDRETSAIHSEPFVNEPRLFMSIVPGTHEQIKMYQQKRELYNKRH